MELTVCPIVTTIVLQVVLTVQEPAWDSRLSRLASRRQLRGGHGAKSSRRGVPLPS